MESKKIEFLKQCADDETYKDINKEVRTDVENLNRYDKVLMVHSLDMHTHGEICEEVTVNYVVDGIIHEDREYGTRGGQALCESVEHENASFIFISDGRADREKDNIKTAIWISLMIWLIAFSGLIFVW